MLKNAIDNGITALPARPSMGDDEEDPMSSREIVLKIDHYEAVQARRRALRALPYLCFLALGAAAGVESCVATLALVACRRSSRARQYRLAAGLPQQICVALSVALKQGAELQFLRSSTHLMCPKALHSLRVPGKALQTDAASTSGPTGRRSLASAHDSKGLPASHARAWSTHG